MDTLWPWVAVAGAGALHGLNPATGWMLAAAWGVHQCDRAQALWALLPMAVGHAASVALVAGAVALGAGVDRTALQLSAAGLFALAVMLHLSGCAPRVARSPAGHAGLALWSFLASTAHGAGLMLVPALMPLCAGNVSTAASSLAGPLTLALAALALHSVAMLAVTGLVSVVVCRGVEARTRWRQARQGERLLLQTTCPLPASGCGPSGLQ